MTAKEIAEREAAAAEHAHRILDLIGANRREELAGFMADLSRADLSWTVLALASALLEQENRNDDLEKAVSDQCIKYAILQRQNETLDTANEQLFAERRALTERVAELRGYLNRRADAAPKRRQ